MSYPLVWPGRYYFYPVGNTSAVSLTRDLAPEESARILLLGCGDPRNVLYTIYFDSKCKVKRKLDFTCNDLDPAIIARNVIIFTMVIDEYDPSIIWNIFIHMKIDKTTLDTLLSHCRKLIAVCENMKKWRSSPYGSCLKMCTAYTLSEIRRHLKLYLEMPSLDASRQTEIELAFQKMAVSTHMHKGEPSFARSCGPFMADAKNVMLEVFDGYWKTGTTFFAREERDAAAFINPTFVYSFGGEGCCVSHRTHPLVPFHLAKVFADAVGKVKPDGVVRAARNQFTEWCTTYRSEMLSELPPVIRFFVGDALAVCEAFETFSRTHICATDIPVAKWTTSRIELDSQSYLSDEAPTQFNVIDTSNLVDHIGLLNCIIPSIPILVRKGVLYTESLIFESDDPTKELAQRLCCDISLFALLSGVCPVDYLSNFTTRSNTHELALYQSHKETSPLGQYQQITTWRFLDSQDILLKMPVLPAFEPVQLGTVFWKIYWKLLHENKTHSSFVNNVRLYEEAALRNSLHTLLHTHLLYHIRETFVLFLKLVKQRLAPSAKDWTKAMDHFMSIHDSCASERSDSSMYEQDLYALFFRHGIYTVDVCCPDRVRWLSAHPNVGKLRLWPTIPPTSRIFLTIPRDKLSVLGMPNPLDPCKGMTYPLCGELRGTHSLSLYTAAQAAFGRVIPIGSPERPKVRFEEDPDGWRGTSPMALSFTIPTHRLITTDPQANLRVSLSVVSTPGTDWLLLPKLGVGLPLFKVPLLNEDHVQIVPEDLPHPVHERKCELIRNDFDQPIGISSVPVVQLDRGCESVLTLSAQIHISNSNKQNLYDARPVCLQLSPCVLEITAKNLSQRLLFPFPVRGSQHKLDFDEPLSFIKVTVPAFSPFSPDTMLVQPFAIVGENLSSWNLHRINLMACSDLIPTNSTKRWLKPHLDSMFSARERSLRRHDRRDVLTSLKDMIRAILLKMSDLPDGVVFGIHTDRGCDTVLLVHKLLLDSQCHTISGDALFLPVTSEFYSTNKDTFLTLYDDPKYVQISLDVDELRAWKHLVAALVERCRDWTHLSTCEYKLVGRIPLSDEEGSNPICSCGCGKDSDINIAAFGDLQLFSSVMTRVSISPLFGVSYLETVVRDAASRRCFVCQKEGNLMQCGACKDVRYCSKVCQRKDWKRHGMKCGK